jgi:hypothetical protein
VSDAAAVAAEIAELARNRAPRLPNVLDVPLWARGVRPTAKPVTSTVSVSANITVTAPSGRR